MVTQYPNNRTLSLADILASQQSPGYSTILGVGLGFTAASTPVTDGTPKWLHVTSRFRAFLSNLELTALQNTDGLTKFHGVVSCLNSVYYGHNSSTDNAFLIGSWAKGTRVRPPRDVDLYFVLPIEVYKRFEQYAHGINKQSAILQEVRSKLLASYPSSFIKGDGPVVLAGFTSFNVEIVPAFLYSSDERSYYVCDTKNGGSYNKTMPLHEVDAINSADVRNSNNVRRLIRMLKAWQSYCSVPIKSFYIELLAINFLDQCSWRNQDYFYYDWISRDYFEWMISKANSYLVAPGTYDLLWIGDAWKSRAESAFARAIKACDYERANDMANAGDEWQKIYGTDIPKWV